MGFIDKAREKRKEVFTRPELKNSSIDTNEYSPSHDVKTDMSKQNTKFSEILKTDFDTILDLITKEDGQTTIKFLAGAIHQTKERVEIMLKLLERQEMVQIIYPINIFSEEKVKINKQSVTEKIIELPSERKLLDTYSIEVDKVKGKVNVWDSPKEDVPIYELLYPKVLPGTMAFIKSVIEDVSKGISVEQEDTKDSKKELRLREDILKNAKKEIKKIIPELNEDRVNTISGIILHEMYGLGNLELLMGDNWLEEVAVNGADQPVSVFHKRFGWTKTTIYLNNESEIFNLASQIGRKVGRQINSLNPLMDANLISGDRVAATLSPISTGGNTLTIRRFSRNPWTIVHLIDPSIKTMSPEIAAFLWLCIQYELNIMIAGGTASGKTSVLNSVCSLIPATQRILSIEDTRELALPDALKWNWVPLSSRKENPEGQGGVTMLDLMVESLRMRPDRIIVGEVRRREQAETLFETMHTGHSVYTTMHADTVEQVERRLVEPPIQIPKTEIQALQLIVVQYRDRRKGARRTLEIAEVLSQENEGKGLGLNFLYRWKPRTDTFEKVNDSIRVMEDLNLHTGMTAEVIEKDLKEKEKILLWMSKHKVNDIDAVGKIMKIYYKTPKVIVEAAEKDIDPFQIAKD